MSDETERRRMARSAERGLACGRGRSEEFRAGHRRAIRAAVSWLHAEALQMNDSRARQFFDSAAFGLGLAARLASEREGEEG